MNWFASLLGRGEDDYRLREARRRRDAKLRKTEERLRDRRERAERQHRVDERREREERGRREERRTKEERQRRTRVDETVGADVGAVAENLERSRVSMHLAEQALLKNHNESHRLSEELGIAKACEGNAEEGPPSKRQEAFKSCLQTRAKAIEDDAKSQLRPSIANHPLLKSKDAHGGDTELIKRYVTRARLAADLRKYLASVVEVTQEVDAERRTHEQLQDRLEALRRAHELPPLKRDRWQSSEQDFGEQRQRVRKVPSSPAFFDLSADDEAKPSIGARRKPPANFESAGQEARRKYLDALFEDTITSRKEAPRPLFNHYQSV